MADDDNNNNNEDGSGRRESKKLKRMSRGFELAGEVLTTMKCDVDNQKLWDDALTYVKQGQQVTTHLLTYHIICLLSNGTSVFPYLNLQTRNVICLGICISISLIYSPKNLFVKNMRGATAAPPPHWQYRINKEVLSFACEFS